MYILPSVFRVSFIRWGGIFYLLYKILPVFFIWLRDILQRGKAGHFVYPINHPFICLSFFCICKINFWSYPNPAENDFDFIPVDLFTFLLLFNILFFSGVVLWGSCCQRRSANNFLNASTTRFAHVLLASSSTSWSTPFGRSRSICHRTTQPLIGFLDLWWVRIF